MTIKIFKLFVLIIICFLTASIQPVLANYQDAKAEYLQAVSVYQQARSDYLTARENLRTVRTVNQTRETFEKAKDFLFKADQVAIKYLQMMRTKVEEANGLTDSERQAILTEIDSDISWLTNKQVEIQTAATKDQLVSLTGQVKNHWQKVRASVKKFTGQILAANVHKVFIKLEGVGNRIEIAINKAKTAGKNTSNAESWLADYQKNLNLAKEKYEAAKAKFAAISNLTEANSLFTQGTAFIREANQYLRQAHKNLKDIVAELKRL